MPLQDLLGEVQTLSQLKHQQFADQLAAQVQKSNMDNAYAATMLSLPTADARAALNTAKDTGNWKPLESAIPEGIDTIKSILFSKEIAQHGVDPAALHEGISTMLSGKGTGDVAKSGLEAQAFNSAGSNFASDLPALMRAVTLSHLTGQGAEQYAVSNKIASDPVLFGKQAAVQAGTDYNAATKLGSDTAIRTNNASVGANIYSTQAGERIAMMGQGTELAKMSMEERLRQFAAKGAMSDKSVEYLKNAQHAYDNLNAGGLNDIGQIGNQQMYNANLIKMVEAGDLSPDALKYQDEGGMLLRPGQIGGQGKLGIAIKKALGIGKQ